MGIRPPYINESWDDCSSWGQAQLIAYEQLRENEESEAINQKGL